MKKLLTGILSLGLCLSIVGCKRKNDPSTKDDTTTTKPSTTIDINTDNDKYQTDYSPIVSDSLPRIDINVNDSEDYMTKIKYETIDSV